MRVHGSMRYAMTFAALLALLSSGCGGRKHIKAAKPPRIGSHETGIASWYGHPYDGRRAANGEIYDMEKLTAAHRTLPFNTWVRVENLSNRKTVEVRIQDRGPFVANRIIDLSHAAAEQIAMIGPGTTKVRLTVIVAPKYPEPASIRPPKPVAAALPVEAELYAVQIGAYSSKARAEALVETMKAQYGAARLVLRQGAPPLWRVLVGEEQTEEKAGELAVRLQGAGNQTFVVRLDLNQ